MCMDRKTAEALYDSGKENTVEWLLRLDAKVDELAEKVAKLSKNSSNSSKPPSNDITNPQGMNRAERRQQKKKNKHNAQWGHQKRERTNWSEDQVNVVNYDLNACPDCAGPLRKLEHEAPRVLQQAELVSSVIEKTEHRGNAYWCPICQRIHYAPIPEVVRREGLFKENISATVCFLKYVGCMSLMGIKRYLQDAMGVKVTKSYLAKVIQKGAKALEKPYDELLRALPMQPIVNSDETGHKENGASLWTWVFRSNLFALFHISPSRGSDVLIDVLGKEFDGVLGCDYFSAYRKYMKDFDVKIQFCLAHLIRDVKYLVDFPDNSVKRYGTKVLQALRDMFHVIHQRDTMSSEKFTAKLEEKKRAVIHAATGYVPARSEARNLAKRFRETWRCLFHIYYISHTPHEQLC